MTNAKPLPRYLADKYRGWKTAGYVENKALYRELSKGQSPRAMVISCCDSRLNITEIFGTDPGDVFLHRNIANLVPPYDLHGTDSGTPAAIEFAVTALGVSHLVIVGHSDCGGVRGYYDLANGNAPKLAPERSFLGRWLQAIKPGYDRIKDSCDGDACVAALEKEAIKVSVENLMTYPFVKEAVEADRLTLHGLWHDIGHGKLMWLDAKDETFKSV